MTIIFTEVRKESEKALLSERNLRYPEEWRVSGVGENGKSDGLLSLVVVNCHCHRVPNIAGEEKLDRVGVKVGMGDKLSTSKRREIGRQSYIYRGQGFTNLHDYRPTFIFPAFNSVIRRSTSRQYQHNLHNIGSTSIIGNPLSFPALTH
ncbi:hypothetical protein X798_02021 [Onchocerca flexuosa]|uniref:Uncharacterized protein n=2 Tax=Onchocerca flexuosa TaxID=387005 RepID=A0A183HYM3_9BILA|nr:hypothetical protein X798_02021 [Onchocerca flexuosa]VDP11679.1 unnamed protein product [Onchocerca flexuosa]